MKRILLLFVTLLCISLPPSAHATDTRLTGFACADLPDWTEIEIEIFDDAAPMLRLRQVLVSTLERRGYGISETASLKLSMEAHAIRQPARRKGRDLGKLSAGGGFDLRMNIWSNRRDSIVGGRKQAMLFEADDEIVIILAIRDKESGRCLWYGEARRDTTGKDQWYAGEALVPLLVNAIGRTVNVPARPAE